MSPSQHRNSLVNFCELSLMPESLFSLSKVDISDAENIARHVDVPAMQNGPLFRTMFPRFDTITEGQKEEIIRWYVNMLEDALRDGQESFLKGCSVDGTPIGLSGWTIIERNRNVRVGASDGQVDRPPKQKQKKETWAPETIDLDGWFALSDALRTERDRVLKDLDNVCRLTFMAVDPNYQRRGIGSMMMRQICEETDRHRRCAYVLAAPEGVRLYAKFGFETVGRVETPQGTITSMFRPSRPPSSGRRSAEAECVG